MEEELYDLLTFCNQNPEAPDLVGKKGRLQKIGRELYTPGGVDAMEKIFFSIEHRIIG
jgi:hypothetical protein